MALCARICVQKKRVGHSCQSEAWCAAIIQIHPKGVLDPWGQGSLMATQVLPLLLWQNMSSWTSTYVWLEHEAHNSAPVVQTTQILDKTNVNSLYSSANLKTRTLSPPYLQSTHVNCASLFILELSAMSVVCFSILICVLLRLFFRRLT